MLVSFDGRSLSVVSLFLCRFCVLRWRFLVRVNRSLCPVCIIVGARPAQFYGSLLAGICVVASVSSRNIDLAKPDVAVTALRPARRYPSFVVVALGGPLAVKAMPSLIAGFFAVQSELFLAYLNLVWIGAARGYVNLVFITLGFRM